MGGDNDPFYRHRHPRDGDEQKYEDYGSEYNKYEGGAPDHIDENKYNNGLNKPTSDDQAPNIPKRRSVVSQPPQLHYTERRTMRTPKRVEYIEERAQPTPRRTAKSTQHITQQANSVARKTEKGRPAPQKSVPQKSVPRKQHKQRVWPIFFTGCASGAISLIIAIVIIFYLTYRTTQNGGLTIPGVVNTNKPYSQSTTQTVPLKKISQVVVCDRAGNVSLKVDQKATSPTVTTTKTVHADSQDHAQQQLNKIAVEIQPPNQLTKPLGCQKPQTANSTSPSATTTATDTTLTINITFPANEVGGAVDVAIALPPLTVPADIPTNNLIAIEAPLGNISIDGMSGVMDLKSVTKDISVQHSVLVDGSSISATGGNITFNGTLFITPIKQGQPAHYILSSGHQLDITLPDNIILIVDASTNVGKISSDFPITPTNNSGNSDASYYGPLGPNNQIDPKTSPLLTLSASTGDVSIHKAKSP